MSTDISREAAEATPLSDEIRTIRFAFSDKGRHEAIEELARKVRALERATAALREERDALKNALTDIVVDEQSLAGIRIVWNEHGDNRHYAYSAEGKCLWSGNPTFNVWRCVRLTKERNELRAECERLRQQLNSANQQHQL